MSIEVESLRVRTFFLSDPIKLNSALRNDFKELNLDIYSDFYDFEQAGIGINVSW